MNLKIIKVYVIIAILKIVTEEERTKCLKAFQGRPLGKQQRDLNYFKHNSFRYCYL